LQAATIGLGLAIISALYIRMYCIVRMDSYLLNVTTHYHVHISNCDLPLIKNNNF